MAVDWVNSAGIKTTLKPVEIGLAKFAALLSRPLSCSDTDICYV